MSDFSAAKAATDYVDFIGIFVAAGALGVRFAALRGRLGGGQDRLLLARVARRAAWLGLAGALTGAAVFATELVQTMIAKHVSAMDLIGNVTSGVAIGLVVLSLVGFGLAAAGVGAGWCVAAGGVIAGIVGQPIYAAFAQGRWQPLVTPFHVLFAGLWLGTLFILIVSALPTILRDEEAQPRRGALTADLVNGFSPLALGCGGLLVGTGVIIAWRHLPTLSALWTTTYGEVLLAKLGVVALVFSLGAWNWRRLRPKLGTEPAAHALRRSAARELGLAAVVLVLTAVLINVPSPRAKAAKAAEPRAQ